MSANLPNPDKYGKSTGTGLAVEGTITDTSDGYHIDISTENGRRYIALVDTVYVSQHEELSIPPCGKFSIDGREFKLNSDELRLRNP